MTMDGLKLKINDIFTGSNPDYFVHVAPGIRKSIEQ
uniref:Uncharacterized protein n=1 Tax=Arundo donax TaxID=35708 RepID=A0A0A8YH64_ARUDO